MSLEGEGGGGNASFVVSPVPGVVAPKKKKGVGGGGPNQSKTTTCQYHTDLKIPCGLPVERWLLFLLGSRGRPVGVTQIV